MGSIFNRLRPKPTPTVVTPEPAVTPAAETAAAPPPEAAADTEETEAPESPSE
jgi:hypothetical protein